MHKAYLIGADEKHRLDFHLSWLSGFVTVSVDRKVVLRRLFFLKIDHSLEIGDSEKHMVTIHFNFFNYFREILAMTIDGQRPAPEMEIQTHKEKFDTPAEDAACAFLFVSIVNLIFAVIGTLYVPDLDSLNDRLLLFLAALLYFLFAVKTAFHQRRALMAGTAVFVLDSIFRSLTYFSVGGIILRIVILFYLVAGIKYLGEREKSREQPH